MDNSTNEKDFALKVREAIGTVFENQRKERAVKYSILNKFAQKNAVLFTGSSLMEQFPIEELSIAEGIDRVIYNRGIGGFTTDDFLENMDTMLLDYKASKIFINIGTNDISASIAPDGKWLDHLLSNYEKILRTIKEKQPSCQVYPMAYYPTNMNIIEKNEFSREAFGIRTLQNVDLANKALRAMAEKYAYHYIDVNEGLCDSHGNLKEELTTDGVHMIPDAYVIILRNMKKYI